MKFTVITSYPGKGEIHGGQTVGIASYTKNTLLAIQKADSEIDLNVRADVLDTERMYMDRDIIVRRNWRRGDVMSLWRLFLEILKDKNNRLIVPIEGNMYGNYLHLAFFMGILGFLRLSGRRIYLIMHEVILDFTTLEKSKTKQRILSIISVAFYTYITLVSRKVIVFEEKLKERLGNRRNIVVIPHATEKPKKITKKAARRRLRLKDDKFYALDFGYISPYKGADTIVDIWPDKPNGKRLILAGGGNPNHMNKKDYNKFVKNVFKTAKEKKIITPGFIDEKKIPLYFAAADVVILPYRVFMSSSGPLALAFAYGKPVLLSEPLGAYFDSRDFKRALRVSGLKKSDLIFNIDPEKFLAKLRWSKKNLKKMKEFSDNIHTNRSWDAIGHKYVQVLTS